MASIKSKKNVMRDVLSFVFAHWRRHGAITVLIAVSMSLATFADVFLPLFAGDVVNDIAAATPATMNHQAYMAVQALLIMAALGCAQISLRFLGMRGILQLTVRTMSDVAQDAFARLQRFSADWHANTFAGSVVRKVTRGMWALDLLNDTILLALLPAIVVLAGSAIMLGLQWPTLGAMVAIGACLFGVLTVLMTVKYVAPAAQLSNAWDTKVGGALADAIGCNAVVKAFGAEEREEKKLAFVLGKWSSRTSRTWRRGIAAGTIQSAALLCLRSLITGLIVWLWWTGHATAGGVTTVLTTYFIIQGYLRDIGYHISNVQRSVNEMEELVGLHSQKLGVADQAGARPIMISSGEVVFDRVGFRYGPHVNPLFDEFNLTIKAGERIGLVGHSGSGKTTFVKLLQRLHDVTAGQIRVDGQDIAQASQQSLRAQIAIVPQEPILFHRSLAENIAYSRPGASQADIEHAAFLANAHDFISKLPKGYGTLVGERGVKLSGGERQRVAIARAFLADAPILILDEATASLDSESEALIQDAMERLMTGRTVIVIAHRLSTVRALDRIVVFDHGRIIEEGTHAALVSRGDGTYRRLFECQALGLMTES